MLVKFLFLLIFFLSLFLLLSSSKVSFFYYLCLLLFLLVPSSLSTIQGQLNLSNHLTYVLLARNFIQLFLGEISEFILKISQDI